MNDTLTILSDMIEVAQKEKYKHNFMLCMNKVLQEQKEISYINFKNLTLHKGKIKDKVFNNCSFNYCDIEYLSFINCFFVGCSFTGTSLFKSDFTNCDFVNTDFNFEFIDELKFKFDNDLLLTEEIKEKIKDLYTKYNLNTKHKLNKQIKTTYHFKV